LRRSRLSGVTLGSTIAIDWMPSLKNLARHAPIIIAGGLVALSLIGGTTFSRYYWGYWFSPPALGPTVRGFARLHAFVSVAAAAPTPNLGWKVSSLSPAQIGEGASWYRDSPVDAFWYRLHAAVENANLQLTPEDSAAPERVLARLEKQVAASELLVDGEPGYLFAKRLNGFAAIGPARSGDTLVVLALKGSEMSNDHYPVFDFAYVCGEREERCRLVQQTLYFEDVAGGFRWYWASLAALFVGVAVVVPAFGFWRLLVGVKQLIRRLKSRAA
jgi:hypothetical protein